MRSSALLTNNGIFVSIFLTIIHHSEGQTSVCATRNITCQLSPYRSYDGSCNNLEHPQWGTSNSRYNRLLPPHYGDGIKTPTLAKDGSALPNAREISFTVYPDAPIVDPKFTLLTMQYGQVVAHDMSRGKNNNQISPGSDKCCTLGGKLINATDPSLCFTILVPKNDPVYVKAGFQCLSFVTTGTDLEYGCREDDNPVEQLNLVNHFLDLSLVYGQDNDGNAAVRLFQGGQLKFETRNGHNWLPRNPNVTDICTSVANSNEACYLAGDIRVNQNPQLTILQTIFLRHHNKIAAELAQLNPQWNDEKIFQETRKICIGLHQQITYYDLLPLLLGKQNMLTRKLIYQNPQGYVNDYNATVNPSVLNVHANAAYRFYHTLIAGHLELLNEKRKEVKKVRISRSFDRPRILEQGNATFDRLARGLATQHQMGADEYHTKEITNDWAILPGAKIGLDLKAICVQRNRDHGLATYNDFRAYCGLPKAHKFNDFLDVISAKNVKKLRKLYKNPDDVDVTVGGSLERLVPNTLAGHTVLCILTEQFYRTRVGDRFFFENSGITGFSLPQLKEIRKAKISKIICDHTDVKKMQLDGFRKISKPGNALKPCNELPSLNLTLWKE